MSKIAKIALVGLFCGSITLQAGGTVIQAQDLPQEAQKFLQTHFPQNAIGLVEKSFDDYEVKLNGEVEVEFSRNGDWKAIKSHQPLIALKYVPEKVLQAIKTKYPQAKIMEVEKAYKDYEIKLDNHRELVINQNGKILVDKL